MSLSVPAPFGWRCLTSPRMRRTPAPPHRTVRAVCPHTALRSPSAAGMRGDGPVWRGGLATTGGSSQRRGVRASRQSPPGPPLSGAVKVRPLPSAEVLLSSACERYYEPLRLPARPRPTSAWPYTPQLGAAPPPTRLSRGAHTRVAGTRLSPHAIPATPEGPGWPGSGTGPPSTGLPPRTTESTPSLS